METAKGIALAIFTAVLLFGLWQQHRDNKLMESIPPKKKDPGRKVRFKKWHKGDKTQAGYYSDFIYNGYFLEFGIGIDDDGGTPASYSIAIIEDTEGEVHAVSIHHFKFLDNAK